MANIPPKTGDDALDQWAYEITQDVNSGELGTGGTGTAEAELDDQGRAIIEVNGEEVSLGYPFRYLDIAYGTDINGANFANVISDLPAEYEEVYQGVRNTNLAGQVTNPASFLWRRIVDIPATGLRADTWFDLPENPDTGTVVTVENFLQPFFYSNSQIPVPVINAATTGGAAAFFTFWSRTIYDTGTLPAQSGTGGTQNTPLNTDVDWGSTTTAYLSDGFEFTTGAQQPADQFIPVTAGNTEFDALVPSGTAEIAVADIPVTQYVYRAPRTGTYTYDGTDWVFATAAVDTYNAYYRIIGGNDILWEFATSQPDSTTLDDGNIIDLSAFATGAAGPQGPDGVAGTSNGYVYKADTAAGLAPTGGSFDADTGVLTPPTGYSNTPPSSTTSGQQIFVSYWIFEDNILTFTTPVLAQIVLNDVKSVNYDGVTNLTDTTVLADIGDSGYFLDGSSGILAIHDVIARDFDVSGSNTRIGLDAGVPGNTTVTSNTSIGMSAGTSINSDRNVFIGSQAGMLATDAVLATTPDVIIEGNRNIGIGVLAMGSTIRGIAETITAEDNIMLGSFTGSNLTSGHNNQMSGFGAGFHVTSGFSNILFGARAGANPDFSVVNALTTGSENVLIGDDTNVSDSDSTNAIAIGGGLTVASEEIAIGQPDQTVVRIGAYDLARASSNLIFTESEGSATATLAQYQPNENSAFGDGPVDVVSASFVSGDLVLNLAPIAESFRSTLGVPDYTTLAWDVPTPSTAVNANASIQVAFEDTFLNTLTTTDGNVTITPGTRASASANWAVSYTDPTLVLSSTGNSLSGGSKAAVSFSATASNPDSPGDTDSGLAVFWDSANAPNTTRTFIPASGTRTFLQTYTGYTANIETTGTSVAGTATITDVVLPTGHTGTIGGSAIASDGTVTTPPNVGGSTTVPLVVSAIIDHTTPAIPNVTNTISFTRPTTVTGVTPVAIDDTSVVTGQTFFTYPYFTTTTTDFVEPSFLTASQTLAPSSNGNIANASIVYDNTGGSALQQFWVAYRTSSNNDGNAYSQLTLTTRFNGLDSSIDNVMPGTMGTQTITPSGITGEDYRWFRIAVPVGHRVTLTNFT